MNGRPYISVIMNCFNSDKYLKEAIESILNQTYKNFEFIFWDNQSTDKSAEIIKSYNDNRIRYFYAHEFTLLGNARNHAISKATGEWIAFLDADDLWEPKKLEKSMMALNEHKEKLKVSLIYTKAIKIDDRENQVGEYTKHFTGYLFDKLLKNGNFIVQSSIMVRKDIFDKVGGINIKLNYCPDYDLILKVAKSYIFIGVNEFLTSYRVHKGSITSSKTYDNAFELINFLREQYSQNNLKFITKIYLKKNILYLITALLLKLIIAKKVSSILKLAIKYPIYTLFFPLAIPEIVLNKIKNKLIW